MENKKLTLTKKKCSVIYVGKSNGNCYDLRVHGNIMQKADSSKYLGDIINKSGKVKENIADRVVKSVASFAVIQAILKDIPLGRLRTKSSLELRQAMFLNRVLFNCETWHNIKDADIAELNLIDNQLL